MGEDHLPVCRLLHARPPPGPDRPDVIKLDLALVRDIGTDAERRALAASLVTFARKNRVKIVAEGIEIPAELDTLIPLGVTQGQGYVLARPTPARGKRHRRPDSTIRG